MFDEARAAEDDQAFADIVQKARNVVLFTYLTKETVALTDAGGAPTGAVHIERLVPPTPLLAQAAVALAPFPLPKVPVKVSQYWTFKTGSSDTPTLPVVAFQILACEVFDEFIRLLEKVSPSQAASLPRNREAILTTGGITKLVQALREVFANEPFIAERMLEELHNARAPSVTVRKYKLLKALIKMYQGANTQYLNFYGPPGTITSIPYHVVLNLQEKSPVDPRLLDLQGKTIFVGFAEHTRLDQKDGFYTVFSQASGLDLSGVEIAATAFANLLEDLPVQPLGLREYLATIVLWGMLLGVLCRLSPTVIAAVLVVGLDGLYLAAAVGRFATIGRWYPLLVPLFFQAPSAFFGAVLWKYFETHQERQNIRKAFGYYLPEKVVEQVSRNVADVKTSNQLVYGICLYTDAEQYTTLAESMHPQDLGSLMNQYYEAVFEPVRRHGGIVSDVVGDAMLAIWATAQPDVALRQQTCLAALDIASVVQRFMQSASRWQIPTRIGLHAGAMLLGNIGALNHYEYRAVGDIVNTASRIEGLNKYLNTRILVSEEALDQVAGLLTRELGTFLFVGKSKPLMIHELLCRLEESTAQQRSLCTLFAEALGAYRRQAWEEAIEKFAAILSHDTDKADGPALFYVKLCEQYREHPPVEAWNGVVRLVKK